jgi:hypothetical protein
MEFIFEIFKKVSALKALRALKLGISIIENETKIPKRYLDLGK